MMGKRGATMAKQEETRVETPPLPVAKKWFNYTCAALVVVFLADFASAVSLYWVLHPQHPIPSPAGFWPSLRDFYTDSLDLVVLALARALLLPGVAYIASRFAHQEECSTSDHALAAALKKKASASKSSPLPVSAPNGTGLHAPLLDGEAGTSENADAGRRVGRSRSGKGDSKKGEEDEKESPPWWEAWLTPKTKKDVLLFGSFLLSTAFQVFVGAKCVAFYFGREGVEGPLMGIAVLWINLESTLAGRLVEAYQTKVRARCREAQKKAAQGGSEGARAASALLGGLKGTGQAGSMILMDPVAAARALRETQLRGDKGLRDEAEVGQRTYLLRALGLARQELGTISIGLLCLALTSASGLILPHYQGSILDRVIAFDEAGFRRDVLLLVSFSLATGIFGGIRGLCFSVVGKRVLKTLQDKLFTGIIKQDVAYFDATTSGELTSRLTNDVGSMAEPLNWMISTLLRSLLQLAGGFLLCFFTSWKLSMLAFTTMAPIMHITATYSRWSRELNRKRYALLAEANSAASEALGNIRTVRAFSTEELELSKYQSKTLAAMTKGVTDAFAYSFAVAINNWLDLGASVLILWYGGVLVMDGHLSIGKLITFQLYWNQIQSGYQTVMQVLMSLTRAAGAAQRVLSLVDALPDIDPNAGTMVSTLEGDMKLEDLHFFYQMRPAQKVLDGINLHVAPGQVCALVGRSGGGKSTIVHLLMRFYDPTGGRVLLDGWDLRSLNLRSVHRHMGVVAQDTQMFATSIEENITYGVDSYTQDELHECARNANAHEFIMQFPDGYATRVGERGVRLSGGQRQRIAIARMLLRKPKVLLLDEATSALDSESEAQVQQALDRLIQQGGRTVVLVAHRLSTVKNADTIVVLDKGRVVEQGTHDDLLRQDGVYSKLVQRQLAKERNKIENPDMDGANQASDEIDSLLE